MKEGTDPYKGMNNAELQKNSDRFTEEANRYGK